MQKYTQIYLNDNLYSKLNINNQNVKATTGNITDLTGYLWEPNSELIIPNTSKIYNVTVKTVYRTYAIVTEFTRFYIKKSSIQEGFHEVSLGDHILHRIAESTDIDNNKVSIVPLQAPCVHKYLFTGGTDSTNRELIAWLQMNGTLKLGYTFWEINNLQNVRFTALYDKVYNPSYAFTDGRYLDFTLDNDIKCFRIRYNYFGLLYIHSDDEDAEIAAEYPENVFKDNIYKRFTITGGADANNQLLISWLQANGTLTPIS